MVYNNRFGDTRGWIRISAAYLDKSQGGEGILVQKTLGEGLALRNDPGAFLIYRDLVTGLEYIRRNQELIANGMYFELGAYQRYVLLDFREVQENQWGHYGRLAAYLGGRGVPSIDEAVKEIYLQALHYPFRALVSGENLHRLMAARVTTTAAVDADARAEERAALLDAIEARLVEVLREVQNFATAGSAQRNADASVAGDYDILLRRVQQSQQATGNPPTGADEPAADLPPPAAHGPDLEALAADIRRRLEATLALPALTRVTPGPTQDNTAKPTPFCGPTWAMTRGLGDALWLGFHSRSGASRLRQ